MTASAAWDVIVIGAGPAGAVAAHQLAIHGYAVLLVDKARFPRAKVCGCCINAHAVNTLETLGLAGVLRDRGPKQVDRVLLTAAGRYAELALPSGLVISRAGLDQALVEGAQHAGAVFRDGTAGEVEPAGADAEMRSVLLTHDAAMERVEASLVLIADGLAGTSLKRLGSLQPQVQPRAPVGVAGTTHPDDATVPSHVIDMTVGQGGYVGRVQLPDGSTDIAAALQPGAIKHAGGRDALIRRLMHEAHDHCPFDPSALNWQGTPPLRRSRMAADHRLLILGDAAGYIEPFTGEGIGWAIDSGVDAARLSQAALNHGWRPSLARRWRRRYRHRVAPQQWICRGITRALRWPGVTALGIGACQSMPALAGPWLRITAGRGASTAGHGSVS